MVDRLLALRLTFDTPLNVGAGALGGSLADRPLVRDARGLPVIPGSTLKGRLRHEVERLAHLFYPDEPPSCTTSAAELLCQEEPCVVCRLFGSPWRPGKLTVSDLALTEPRSLVEARDPIQGELRYGVGLSRQRRVSEDQLLFTAEVVAPGVPLIFEGTIRGELDAQEMELVSAAVLNVRALGSAKSRGLGWFDAELEELAPPAEPVARVRAGAEWLEVTLTLESPLLLGTEASEDFFNPTRRHIPGSVLRGSLARVMLSDCPHGAAGPHSGCDFGVLFQALTAPVFEHLYPVYGDARLAFPAPLTARSCKRHPGFASGRREEDRGHGVGDILIRQALFEHMLSQGLLLPGLYRPRCPVCGDEVDRYDEFLVLGDDWMDSISVPMRRTSRTAIDRRRAVSADAQLYTIETIEPLDSQRMPTRFQGRVRAAPEQLATLARWLPRVRAIGRRSSSGLGQVEVQVRSMTRDDDAVPTIDTRLRSFNDAVRREWDFYTLTASAEPLPPLTQFFSLGFLSPASLSWRGLPVTAPPAELLGLPGRVTLERTFAAGELLGGWHMGAGLPRRTQHVVSMGSVFLYRVEGVRPEELLEPLAALEETGLGADRSRGLGRVLACSPFHYAPEVEL